MIYEKLETISVDLQSIENHINEFKRITDDTLFEKILKRLSPSKYLKRKAERLKSIRLKLKYMFVRLMIYDRQLDWLIKYLEHDMNQTKDIDVQSISSERDQLIVKAVKDQADQSIQIMYENAKLIKESINVTLQVSYRVLKEFVFTEEEIEHLAHFDPPKIPEQELENLTYKEVS